MFEYAIIIIFIIGYAAIAFEHTIGINKAASALLTAVLCWSVLAFQKIFAPNELSHELSARFGEHLQGTAEIVFFLIGAMTIVELMQSHGGFQMITRCIKTSNKRTLLWTISFITFFLTPILGLLPTAIVMVSLLPQLLENREDRLIFSSMIILAANAGGAWSPIGDVTTTMLWIGGQVSAFGLIKKLFLPCAVCMIIPLIYFSFTIKKGPIEISPKPPEELAIGGKRVFFLGLLSLISIPVFAVLTGLPPVVGVFLGLGTLWLLTDLLHLAHRPHLRIQNILSKIDLTSILFFLGILLAIASLDTAGILKKLSLGMDQYFQNKDIIATLIGLSSAIIDNVPLTAATIGMYPLATNPIDSKLWELLAYSVGTGGSILIIGSAAGVVVMGAEKIDFMWYLKKVSLPALLGYFAGIGTYLLIYRFFI
ncbi:MAG: sodium:proton antiporter NhaD [Candidatus Omnitrophica bacterium]|nr:sodium:proton antiporter NhaD [Candidatus Omnitrophota bacterium]